MEFSFSENGTVENLDRVPEQFRGMYAANTAGEGFVLQDGFKGVGAAIDGLNQANRSIRQEMKKNKVDLSALSEFGSTPEEIAQRVNTRIEELSNELKVKGGTNPDKIRAELQDGFQKALGAKDTEIQQMFASLQRHMVVGAATAAIAEAKGVPDLLLPHITSQVKVLKEGTDYVVRVVDKDGDVRHGVTAQPMTIQELVAEMKNSPTFGRAFESEAAAGSGARNPTTGRGAAPARPPTPGLSSQDKIARGLEKGLARRAG